MTFYSSCLVWKQTTSFGDKMNLKWNLTHCILNTLPHYVLEESNINFRYIRLWDLHIPREKWLNYLQTLETLIRRRILRHLIWVCIVCQLPFYESPNYNELKNFFMKKQQQNITTFFAWCMLTLKAKLLSAAVAVSKLYCCTVLYLPYSTQLQHCAFRIFKITGKTCINPCPAKPGYTLPLQTV